MALISGELVKTIEKKTNNLKPFVYTSIVVRCGKNSTLYLLLLFFFSYVGRNAIAALLSFAFGDGRMWSLHSWIVKRTKKKQKQHNPNVVLQNDYWFCWIVIFANVAQCEKRMSSVCISIHCKFVVFGSLQFILSNVWAHSFQFSKATFHRDLHVNTRMINWIQDFY